MTSVKAALLFVGNPTLALEHFAESLDARLTPLGIKSEEITPLNGATVTVRAAGVTISVFVQAKALAADTFTGSMDSPLSKPVIGILSETLARHCRHLMVSVSEPVVDEPDPTDLLTRLKLAHATTSLLAEWHMPAAVHWQQSNILLTGAQYLQLVSDACPWALFARAQVTLGGEPDQMVRLYGLRLNEAIDFIGRPVTFSETNLPIDEIHAAALSFLRHAVQTGAAIEDGHTFGPKDGPKFCVAHIAANEEFPKGKYELSVDSNDADTALGGAARTPKAILIDPDLPLPIGHPMAGVDAANPRARTRSMAISYLMLVIMPPVGAVLLMSNAIFGSNVFRTGVVAAASVALAVAVGTYTFVNNSQDSVFLMDTSSIQSLILEE